MTAKRPSRFAAWQEAKQIRRETLIDEYLAYLSKTRVRVRNPTDLADLVAKHISQVEGEPCNKSTLMRNVRYKAKLLTYQAKHLEPGAKALNQRGLDDPATRVLITTSKLETGNLKRELDRLKIYVKSLEEDLDELHSKGRRGLIAPASKDGEPQSQLIDEYEFRFVRTCQALRSLLSHLNVVVEIDSRAQCILDRSKRRDNVIVNKEVAGPFFEWLEGAPQTDSGDSV